MAVQKQTQNSTKTCEHQDATVVNKIRSQQTQEWMN